MSLKSYIGDIFKFKFGSGNLFQYEPKCYFKQNNLFYRPSGPIDAAALKVSNIFNTVFSSLELSKCPKHTTPLPKKI